MLVAHSPSPFVRMQAPSWQARHCVYAVHSSSIKSSYMPATCQLHASLPIHLYMNHTWASSPAFILCSRACWLTIRSEMACSIVTQHFRPGVGSFQTATTNRLNFGRSSSNMWRYSRNPFMRYVDAIINTLPCMYVGMYVWLYHTAALVVTTFSFSLFAYHHLLF